MSPLNIRYFEWVSRPAISLGFPGLPRASKGSECAMMDTAFRTPIDRPSSPSFPHGPQCVFAALDSDSSRDLGFERLWVPESVLPRHRPLGPQSTDREFLITSDVGFDQISSHEQGGDATCLTCRHPCGHKKLCDSLPRGEEAPRCRFRPPAIRGPLPIPTSRHLWLFCWASGFSP